MSAQRFDLTSQNFKRDPFSTLTRIREAGPLVRVRLPMIGEIWMATTYESVTTLMRDQEKFVLEPRHAGRKGMPGIFRWMPWTFRLLAKNMLTADEPDHRRLRGLVEQAFLRQSVEGMRSRLEFLADRQLDELERNASDSTGGVDFVRHFARPFPLAVICELLGLPEEDRPRFSKFAKRLTKATSARGMLAAIPGVWRLIQYLRKQFQSCRKQPRPGLISSLVEAEQDGKRLSEDELLAMTFLLLLAGHETTVHLISDGVLALMEHQDQRCKLMSDWPKSPLAVDEVLRYMSPVQMTKPRYVAKDMELFGQRLRRGDICIALLASANLDPAEFEEPEKFDVNRRPNQHVTFGTGIHVCLGLKLARAEAAIAFEKVFTRFPNVELATGYGELTWIERLGIRAVSSMPLRLNRDSESTPARLASSAEL